MPVLENRQESAPFGCGLWIMPDGEAVVYLSGNLDAGSYAGQPRDRFQLASPSDQLISVMRATGLRVKFSS